VDNNKPLARAIAACTPVGKDSIIDAYAAQHGGRKFQCADCAQTVWAAPSSQDLIAAGATPVCLSCADKRMRKHEHITLITPKAASELEQMSRDDTARN
jgi:hypothetical protein